ncbi:MAG: lamin tail domain-containing protein, partial [Bacteroidia bacterium]|nr:lamin tail domain-containing protein [Bacteroidia bacterium]
MKKLYFYLIALLVSTVSFAQTTDLLISKYGEGSSNNKFLEIYNGTGSAVNLDNYAFPNVSNAPNVPGAYEFWNTFPSGYMLADGDVFVIAHGSADPSILAVADMTFNFLSNGDDGFALVANDGTWNDANMNMTVDEGEMTGFTILDWLGNWDGDPGTGWDVAGVVNGTQDHTLTRKSSVCSPNNNWALSAGTDANNSEWIVGAIDSGWGSLGAFVGCSSTPTITITSPGNSSVLPWGTTMADVLFSTENAPAMSTIDITVTINAGAPSVTNDVASPFNISPLADGDSIEVTVDLIDGGILDSDTITFSIENTPPSLPLYDSFDYGVGQNLSDQTNWSMVNSGDLMLINAGNLSYPGLEASAGQSVSFDGGGSETDLEFFPVTSGSVYASFILEVNDHSAITDLIDGGYFAAIADGTSSYDARMWVRPNPDAVGTTFDIGFGYVSSSPPFTAGTFNLGDDIFVVMSYDLDTSTVSAWINPDGAD